MEYIEFTKEMKKNYKILIPMMLPIHFDIIQNIFQQDGFQLELLYNDGQPIIDEGLKHVHNDTCYPALIVIGQMIDALKSGNYDLNHVALAITQTGGGCRASNYIFLLRKALKQAGFGNIPVISVNFSGLEKHSGFKLSSRLLLRSVYALIYGDVLMWLQNQSLPYELQSGDTKKVLNQWTKKIIQQSGLSLVKNYKRNIAQIVKDFEAIAHHDEKKIKVGIVGEIYMKYAPAGNNHLETFLLNENCEPVLSGVMDFGLYCIENMIIDYEYYKQNKKAYYFCKWASKFVQKRQHIANQAIKKDSHFETMDNFEEVKENGKDFIDKGVKMGEGWLLTSEMVTLIKSGVNNIVCCQPFGCLPNHIVARGMMRKLKDAFPQSNIVAIDYDPSATSVNQENRLKLMIANAKLNEHI